jgi:hypothetical protein
MDRLIEEGDYLFVVMDYGEEGDLFAMITDQQRVSDRSTYKELPLTTSTSAMTNSSATSSFNSSTVSSSFTNSASLIGTSSPRTLSAPTTVNQSTSATLASPRLKSLRQSLAADRPSTSPRNAWGSGSRRTPLTQLNPETYGRLASSSSTSSAAATHGGSLHPRTSRSTLSSKTPTFSDASCPCPNSAYTSLPKYSLSTLPNESRLPVCESSSSRSTRSPWTRRSSVSPTLPLRPRRPLHRLTKSSRNGPTTRSSRLTRRPLRSAPTLAHRHPTHSFHALHLQTAVHCRLHHYCLQRVPRFHLYRIINKYGTC